MSTENRHTKSDAGDTGPEATWALTRVRGVNRDARDWAAPEVVATAHRTGRTLTLTSFALRVPPVPGAAPSPVDPATMEHLHASGQRWLTIADMPGSVSIASRYAGVGGDSALESVSTRVTLPMPMHGEAFVLRTKGGAEDTTGVGLAGVVVLKPGADVAAEVYLPHARRLDGGELLLVPMPTDGGVEDWIAALGPSHALRVHTTPPRCELPQGNEIMPGWHTAFGDQAYGKNLLWAVWADSNTPPNETWYQYNNTGIGSQSTSYWNLAGVNQTDYTPPQGYTAYYHAVTQSKSPQLDTSYAYYYAMTDSNWGTAPAALVAQDDPVAPTSQIWWLANGYTGILDTKSASTVTFTAVDSGSVQKAYNALSPALQDNHAIKQV